MDLLIMGTFMLISFYFGFKIGNMKINKEKIELPTINPVKLVKETKERKADLDRIRKEQEVIDINLENIDSYDGTGLGQKDFNK